MLLFLPIFSQSDTIVKLPFSVAKKIALDLVEKDRLEAVERVNVLQISNLKEQINSLEITVDKKDLQLGLLNKNITILDTQLEAEKMKKPKPQFLWYLLIAAAGYIVGSL